VLVGHGLGGGVAQILATRLYREQTAALVLIDTICYLHAFAPNWPLTDMAKRQDVDAPKQMSLEELVKDLRSTLPQAVQNTKGFARVIDNYIAPWNSELGKEVLFRHISLLIPTYVNSVSSDLKDLGKPVLIIWGERDEQTPIQYGQRLHQEIPGSIFATIPNTGHLVLFDAPEAVSQALGAFIQQL
jgi:pimeloyl-ACP methyl ester carboxylesterase